MNKTLGKGPEPAVLAETNLTLGRPTFYGRYEFVRKNSEEPDFHPSAPPSEPLRGRVFNVTALTLGTS